MCFLLLFSCCIARYRILTSPVVPRTITLSLFSLFTSPSLYNSKVTFPPFPPLPTPIWLWHQDKGDDDTLRNAFHSGDAIEPASRDMDANGLVAPAFATVTHPDGELMLLPSNPVLAASRRVSVGRPANLREEALMRGLPSDAELVFQAAREMGMKEELVRGALRRFRGFVHPRALRKRKTPAATT
jgi:hypothetical protein